VLAEVSGQPDNLHFGMQAVQFPHNIPTAVSSAIFHKNQFVALPNFLKYGSDAIPQHAKSPLASVNRYDY